MGLVRKDIINTVFNEVFIPTSRLQDIIQDVISCKKSFSEGIEPASMLIMAGSGFGKTRLIRFIASKYPRKVEVTEYGEQDIIPVLVVTLKSNSTKKDAATAMLEALGDPNPTKGVLLQMTERILKLLSNCRVELIIIDEFSHIVQSNSSRVLGKTADWVKDIIKPPDDNPQKCPKIPLVAFGMYNSIRILQANSQLDTLVSKKAYIFPYGITEKDELEYYRKFLGEIEIRLNKYNLDANILNEPDILYRIFSASNGVPRHIMKLIAYACGSPKTKSNKLSANSFLDAYPRVFGRQKQNPFSVNMDKLALLEHTTYTAWMSSGKDHSLFGNFDQGSLINAFNAAKQKKLF